MANQTFSDHELRERLAPDEYECTQNAGTERAFTGRYWDLKDDGVYHCVVCHAPLFTSHTKFESGSGWPSFWEAVSDDAIARKTDRSLFSVRTEVLCGNCDAHLGHVFSDGPQPTGERFCMNSVSLKFDPTAETQD